MATEKRTRIVEIQARVVGLEQLQAADRAMKNAASASKQAGEGFKQASSSLGSGGFGNNIRNASYQMTDFVVQVQGGQDAMRAFSQQAPQLLAAFGGMGAAIGLVAAVMPTVVAALGGASVKMQEASKAAEIFSGSMNDLNRLASNHNLDQLAESFNKLDAGARKIALSVMEARLEIGKLTADQERKNLKDYIDSFGDVGSQYAYIKITDRLGLDQASAGEVTSIMRGLKTGTLDYAKALEALNKLGATGNNEFVKFYTDIKNGAVTLEELKQKQNGLAQSINTVTNAAGKNIVSQEELTDAAKKQADALKKAADELQKIKDAAADREIDAITRQFDDMAKATKAAADEMTRLREAAMDRELDAIASSFDRLKGANPLTTIADELNALGQRVRDLDALRDKLDELYFSGKITSEQFEHLGKKFGTFVETATSSQMGGKLTGLAGILDSNFNSFFENMERGTASASEAFKRMAESILAQILRLAAQKVILSAFGLDIGGGKKFAKGGAFGGATGLPWGVYDKPTYFNMPGNGPLQKYAKGGVLGEAGAEAILPLRRTSSGKLGVESTAPVVNIYNSSGASVRAEEDQNGGIAVYIEQVKNSISRDIRSGAGVVTSALQGTYGLSRAAGAR